VRFLGLSFCLQAVAAVGSLLINVRSALVAEDSSRVVVGACE
jgi:hypothetical protein